MLSIIIVSFNTREVTLACLRSLYAALPTLMPCEVFIIDNASSDGSAEAITSAFPMVRLIRNEANVGFGKANNQCFAKAAGSAVLLLNSDTIVHAGALDALLSRLRSEPKIGVVGPRLLNDDGSLQRSAYRFPEPVQAWLENLSLSRIIAKTGMREDFEQWPHEQVREVPWLSGACLLVKREALNAVGGFDEQFFMYQEETDWQRRIRETGMTVVFEPKAVITHLGGRSGEGDRPRINEQFFTSLDRYVVKYYGRLGFVSIRAAMVVGCSLRIAGHSARWLAQPSRRAATTAKLRMMKWLFYRQLTAGLTKRVNASG